MHLRFNSKLSSLSGKNEPDNHSRLDARVGVPFAMVKVMGFCDLHILGRAWLLYVAEDLFAASFIMIRVFLKWMMIMFMMV